MRRWANGWIRVGVQARFYVKTIGHTVDVLRYYRSELLRLIAQMGLGTGALAVIGGTVVIVGFLTMTTGALVAVAGYNQFADIGVEALTGFASAYFNVRLAAPLTAGVALAATIGAGATAQLGAMRINEEIDALEVMGIRAIGYLVSTRVVAGVIVVIPLYGVAVLSAFASARFSTTAIYGQSAGVYDHYFKTFLYPVDLIWSFLIAAAMAVVIMLVHTYYGFFASGGPGGSRRGRWPGGADLVGVLGGVDRVSVTGHLRSDRQFPPVGLNGGPRSRAVSGSPGLVDRRNACRSVRRNLVVSGNFRRDVHLLRACHADVGSRGPRHGAGRRGQDARCAGGPGGPRRGRSRTRSTRVGLVSRPGRLYTGQCTGTDSRHYRLRCQVRGPDRPENA